MITNNAFKELQRIFQVRRDYVGRIYEITGNRAKVATGGGVRSARITQGLAVNIGDNVIVQGGLITGTTKRRSQVPVFQL